MGRLKIANVKELEPILKSTKLVNDKRTITEQLIDQIICGNEKRYHLYRELRAPGEKLAKDQFQAMEYFMKPWDQPGNRTGPSHSEKQSQGERHL